MGTLGSSDTVMLKHRYENKDLLANWAAHHGPAWLIHRAVPCPSTGCSYGPIRLKPARPGPCWPARHTPILLDSGDPRLGSPFDSERALDRPRHGRSLLLFRSKINGNTSIQTYKRGEKERIQFQHHWPNCGELGRKSKISTNIKPGYLLCTYTCMVSDL
ncbi:hypothetical protein SORBI_3009G121150 [Sorghum bicolor]|uniref:Uncharacterized protein n=1 Tax=Sorghum bicolor TaxID=4558 RepID=A0A1Z5R2C8_SORBI|nr:hypothetical protein SORBI_3009G121150 [Sorghum bicolor]